MIHPRLLSFLRAVAAAVASSAAVPALAGAGRLGGGEPLGLSLGRIVAALIFCLMIAGLAVLVLRQRGGKLALPALFSRIELRARAIQVLETRRLSQHADLCLLRHDGREYLLLLMAGEARVLNERAAAEQLNAKAGEG